MDRDNDLVKDKEEIVRGGWRLAKGAEELLQ